MSIVDLLISHNRIGNRFSKYIAKTDAVLFGDFTLKNGSKSNVFFNFGNICKGSEIKQIGYFFTEYIIHKLNIIPNYIDAIYGPPYKGINIAIATSIVMSKYFDIPFVYSRKQAKDHAEGGNFVGHDLTNEFCRNIIIVDDVFTDGGTKYETLDMLSKYPNVCVRTILVGIDRQEKDKDGNYHKAIFEEKTGIKVHAITDKETVLKYKNV